MGLSHLASNVNRLVRLTRGTRGLAPRSMDRGSRAEVIGGAEREVADRTLRMVTPPGDRSQDVLSATFEVLDALGIGLILVDASCHLLQANRSARVILQARDGLSVDGAGLLRASRGTTPTLAELLGRLLAPAMAGFPMDHLIAAVRRPFGGAFTMLVCRPNTPLLRWSLAGLAVPIFLLDQGGHNPTSIPALRAIFGLTNAEGRLANLLMEGVSLQACGEQLGIRRNTVAFHMKNLYRKTGTHGQNQLVSVLFRSIGLVSGANSALEFEPRPARQGLVSVRHEKYESPLPKWT